MLTRARLSPTPPSSSDPSHEAESSDTYSQSHALILLRSPGRRPSAALLAPSSRKTTPPPLRARNVDLIYL